MYSKRTKTGENFNEDSLEARDGEKRKSQRGGEPWMCKKTFKKWKF